MPISRQSVLSLSGRQRQFLLSHIDGPRPVTVRDHNTRSALVAKNLIRQDRGSHPRQTFLTQDGREAVSTILSIAAEALVAAGALDAEIAAQVKAAIKARDSRQAALAPREQIPPTALL